MKEKIIKILYNVSDRPMSRGSIVGTRNRDQTTARSWRYDQGSTAKKRERIEAATFRGEFTTNRWSWLKVLVSIVRLSLTGYDMDGHLFTVIIVITGSSYDDSKRGLDFIRPNTSSVIRAPPFLLGLGTHHHRSMELPMNHKIIT